MATKRRRWFLREWRENRGLSQEELGAKVGVTQGMISQWETGRSNYDNEHIEQLAAALDITTYELLFVDPRYPDDPLAIYQSLAPREQRQAIELMKTLKRTEG